MRDDMETNTLNVMFDGSDDTPDYNDEDLNTFYSREHLLSHVDDLQHDSINLPLWVKANRSR